MMNEEEVIKFWQDSSAYRRAKQKRAGARKFYFLDGPPYATGDIHMGTAMNKILKDAYIRFWRMRGFDVWDQPGYDTHGLPIEKQVEKEFSIASKSDIERLGIGRFVEACRSFATKYIGIMNRQFADLGVWLDWDNPYLTLTNEYIEGAWHTFKVAYDKGFLYKGLYPVHVCPRCETAVAYNEIEYAKLTDPSIYVKFPLGAKEFLVIWTTTPWTLPANTGVMAKPGAEYAKVEAGGEILIMAKQLVESVMKRAGIAYSVTETLKGEQLAGVKYEHPLKDVFPFQKALKNAHRVVLSDQYVSLEEGTGLVHTAPGHGQEDYKVGKEEKLPAVSPVRLDGTFDETTGSFAGIFVKAADRKIIDALRERGLLLAEERITHDYPQCWRCDTPLLQISVPQWFFRVTKMREKLMKENKKVKWQPGWAKARFDNWLESLGDWPISRQRYWGIPLPIWTCSCGAVRVIGSADELPARLEDLHRPFIDGVTLKCECGSEMRRIPDVLDVWFDAGLASWASLGYPKRKDLFKKLWPADLNIEGPDQIRGWWNSQLITSVITFNKSPFRRILFHGFVLDAHGIKMSKSKGNLVAPQSVVAKHGRDALRFYLLSGAAWDDFYFKWPDVEDVARQLVIARNTFSFAESGAHSKPRSMRNEDRWLLSRLNILVEEVTGDMESYNMHKACQKLLDFIVSDLSRWYIKLVRDRVRQGDASARYALFSASRTCARLLAPVAPFLAEAAWHSEDSVHAAEWPKPEKKLIKKQLNDGMDIVKQIVEATNAMRKESGLKLRWPVRSVSIEAKSAAAAAAIKDFGPVIKDMANCEELREGQSVEPKKEFPWGIVYLDTAVVKESALLRELLRAIQAKRKELGLTTDEKIVLYLDNELLRSSGKEIKEKVGAADIRYEAVAKPLGSAEFESVRISFGFEKI